jgi:hypothetical protein
VNPEEANSLRERIRVLRSTGEQLAKEELKLDLSKLDKTRHSLGGKFELLNSELKTLVSEQDLEILRYQLKTWIQDVRALITTGFKENEGLISWTSNLSKSVGPIDLEQYDPKELRFNTRPRSLKLPLRVRGLLKSGTTLLDTASRSIVVDTRGPASDPLRLIVEDTVKEKYFESWPFRLVLIVLGLLIALLFGGNIYMEWKTKGAIAEAEEVLGNIRKARDDADREKAQLHEAFNNAITRIESVAGKEATADEVLLLPHGRAFLLPCASAFQRISVPSGATLVD